jgi:cysteine-rich repeat protein
MGCLLDDEVLAFARRGLPDDGREAAEAHIAGCSACLHVVAEALRALADGGEPGDEPSARSGPADGGLLRPGARVARFEILERLGVGASGVVYRARDPQLARHVALKLVRPDVGHAEAAAPWQRRFLLEAQAMARLSHPNVVVVYEAGVLPEGGETYIAMELVEGESLARWLAPRSRGLDEVIGVFRQVAQGLAAAHDAGLVHGDFKPDNVLVGVDGRPRITDFGLARPAAAPAGAVVGTPLFMAPEIFTGGPADARSDQFAFCVALYTALYDRHPFADGADAPLELSAAALKGEVRRPAPYHGVPPEIFGVVARGLRPRAGDRHPSMAALARALEDALRRARGRALRRRALAAVAAGLVGAVVGAVLWRVIEGPRCGNGRPEPGEACDDGNRSTSDGCVACRFARCGDGHVREQVEACDDGNDVESDGCSSACVACGAAPCAAPIWRTRPGTSQAYGAFGEAVAWDEARERCRLRGGHLATLQDEAEHAFVAGWARQPLWIGAGDGRREGEMRWVTGEAVAFARFALGEPDDRNGQSDCVAIDRDGRWHDRPCFDAYGYLCEID